MKLSNIFTNILALSTIALAVACNEKEQCTELRTIKAVIERSDTRTSLEGPDANEVYKTVWTSGDEIAVYSGENTAKQFKLKSGENTNKGVFEGAAGQGNLVAVYPYSIAKGRDGSTVSVNLPDVQEYMKGNIPKGAYPMVASSDNDTFSFKNLCSVLRVSMFGDATVKSIIFTPAKDGIGVAGNASIKVDSKELVMADDAIPSIKLNCPDVKLSDTAVDFHIVVPAQEYPGGFTITINTDKGDVVKSLKSDITLSRSVLYPIEAFECKASNTITFEDANFKAYMIANFDTDNDDEISYSEALAVTKIDVRTGNIKSLAGIEHLPNLTFLNCNGPNEWDSVSEKYVGGGGLLKNLDISRNTSLTVLCCGFNQLTSLDVSKNKNLSTLYCDGNRLEKIDISGNTELKRFKINDNLLTSIDLGSNTQLTLINVENNNLTSLDLGRNTELLDLDCDGNKITALDLSRNRKLTRLSCYGNKLSELDLQNSASLESLDCGNNKITDINLGPCTNLKKFWCRNGSFASIELNCCPNLEYVNLFNNAITTLNISEISGLKELDCSNNPLEALYIYKGQVENITTKKIPSTTKIVIADDPSEWADREFWHKSLGMRFTATWCGYCPNLATGFAKAVSQYPNKIELLNLHPTSSILGFSGTSALANIFKVTGYPTGMIDYRKQIDNYSSDYAATLVVNAVKETESNYPVKTGISFSSSVSGNTLTLDIKLYIKEKGDYKVTAILLEDGIVGFQNGAGNDYVHNRIARLAITEITGNEFSTSADFKTVKKHYSAALPSSLNKGNLYILVYVLKQYGSQTIIRTADYGDYYVDNAASAAVGTVQELVLLGGNEDMTDGGEITLN